MKDPTFATLDRLSRIPGRLTLFDFAEIQAAHRAGLTVKSLAKCYSRSCSTIYKILKKEVK